jgi:hypothetical protein
VQGKIKIIVVVKRVIDQGISANIFIIFHFMTSFEMNQIAVISSNFFMFRNLNFKHGRKHLLVYKGDSRLKRVESMSDYEIS